MENREGEREKRKDKDRATMLVSFHLLCIDITDGSFSKPTFIDIIYGTFGYTCTYNVHVHVYTVYIYTHMY